MRPDINQIIKEEAMLQSLLNTINKDNDTEYLSLYDVPTDAWIHSYTAVALIAVSLAIKMERFNE